MRTCGAIFLTSASILAADFSGGDRDGVGALEAFVDGLLGLHEVGTLQPLERFFMTDDSGAFEWRRLVRAKGLEPPHLSILVPKTSASTNSATPACPNEAARETDKAPRANCERLYRLASKRASATRLFPRRSHD
jgi:hypothetical protein